MSREKYTHVQALLPEIRAMEANGKTKREIAEHFGLRDKYVVKQLLTRERRKEERIKAGILPRSKGRPKKRVKKQNWNVCAWKTNYCGIFCNQQKGSESTSKVCCHSSPLPRIPGLRYVPVFWSIKKWIL